MTTATANQFDVDRCIEDGYLCEVTLGQGFDGRPTWVKARYIGPDGDGGHVVRLASDGPARGSLAERDDCFVRNIQPKPRTVQIQAWIGDNGVLQIERLDEPHRVNTTLPAADAKSITIDLDKCEQVQPDGVMTPDELMAYGLYVKRLCGGRLVIERPNGHLRWAIGAGWISPGGEYRATTFDTFAVAYKEATRIVKEGLHHA